jgi:hypothetical protein
MIRWAVMLLMVLVASCDLERPPLEEDLYVTLLTESMLIQAAYNAEYDTLITLNLYHDVLKHYDVTHEDFVESHRIYQLDIEEQERRLRRVLDALTAESSRLMAK